MTSPSKRLSAETSPYLLQHAQNPVDWYPWGDEAFARAKQDDKPILLSVGYSACHWCHVMAHESFEDQATAELMNRHFVNIKVDREERPDVDAVYMAAVQALTGAGGWPMTVVMTPEGKPFFGGTYFPPEDRQGQPSFKRVLQALAQAWQQQREEVLSSAENLTQHLDAQSQLPVASGQLTKDLLDKTLARLSQNFDPQHGGFGGAPKFPPHSILKFLLKRPEKSARAMVELTLQKLAAGGIFDQLGGGFARYSVDERWLVPHFEKMLYDNAQLTRRYLEAYQLTGQEPYKRVAEDTLEWLKREMLDASGGFYSSLDADSTGEEGKFYLWQEAEFDTLLAKDAPLAKTFYGISAAGNFEGSNILYVPQAPLAVAENFALSLEELETKLGKIRQILFSAREKRSKPDLDDKILCSWNGLALAAFADAGRILQRRDYLEIALKNAQFIRRELYQNGRLQHSYKAGKAKIDGLLEDYAYYGLGLLALYRASFDSQWLMLALSLAQRIVTDFADPGGSGFFSTAKDAEALVIRPKDYFDAALPSGNGAAAELLLWLARYTGKQAWDDLAAEAIKPLQDSLSQHPNGFGTVLSGLELHLSAPREIAVFGDPDKEDTQALIQELNSQVLPHTVVALAQNADDPLVAHLPFLQNRDLINGQATAYVCEGNSCQLPVTTAWELRAQLEQYG